jgi:hypothetical protein
MKQLLKWTAWLSCLLVMFCGQVFAQDNESIEQIIQRDLNALNSICPREVEKGVVLNGAKLLPGRTVEYVYSLKNITQKTYDAATFQRDVVSALKTSLKSNPQMQPLRDNQITLSFVFVDRNGAPLHKFKFLPSEY